MQHDDERIASVAGDEPAEPVNEAAGRATDPQLADEIASIRALGEGRRGDPGQADIDAADESDDSDDSDEKEPGHDGPGDPDATDPSGIAAF